VEAVQGCALVQDGDRLGGPRNAEAKMYGLRPTSLYLLGSTTAKSPQHENRNTINHTYVGRNLSG
jgi:hypothetical protein